MKTLTIICLSILSFCLVQQSFGQSPEESKIFYYGPMGKKVYFTLLPCNFVFEIEPERFDGLTISDSIQGLYQDGKSLMALNAFPEAIQKFKIVIEKIPAWTAPHYKIAMSYLRMNDSPNALRYFQIADSLYPDGFDYTKTAIWCLQKEQNKEFPKGFYSEFLSYEIYMSDDKLLEMLTHKAPKFAPGWEVLLNSYEQNGGSLSERLHLIKQGLACHPDATIKGNLLIKKANILYHMNKLDEAIKLYADILADHNMSKLHLHRAQFRYRIAVLDKLWLEKHIFPTEHYQLEIPHTWKKLKTEDGKYFFEASGFGLPTTYRGYPIVTLVSLAQFSSESLADARATVIRQYTDNPDYIFSLKNIDREDTLYFDHGIEGLKLYSKFLVSTPKQYQNRYDFISYSKKLNLACVLSVTMQHTDPSDDLQDDLEFLEFARRVFYHFKWLYQ